MSRADPFAHALRLMLLEDPVSGGDDFFKTGHGLRLVETRLRLGEDLMEWFVQITPKCHQFPIISTT